MEASLFIFVLIPRYYSIIIITLLSIITYFCITVTELMWSIAVSFWVKLFQNALIHELLYQLASFFYAIFTSYTGLVQYLSIVSLYPLSITVFGTEIWNCFLFSTFFGLICLHLSVKFFRRLQSWSSRTPLTPINVSSSDVKGWRFIDWSRTISSSQCHFHHCKRFQNLNLKKNHRW